MSAICRMMLKAGKTVNGSNLSSLGTDELEKLGAKIFIGHQASNLTSDVDLVVYSAAVPEDNPERIRAVQLNIAQLSYPEFLGELSKDKFTVAVSGTNGKSTTTAILGLMAGQLDPTVIVGSKLTEWDGNFRLGLSKYFIVEACEWNAHMLNLSPKMIVLTNLEEDHLDYYRDINHITETFQAYIEKLDKQDLLVINVDDDNLKKLKPRSRVLTYGIKNPADLMAQNIKVGQGWQEFDLVSQKFNLNAHFKIKIPGIFNVYNFLAAISVAHSLGVPMEEIKNRGEQFTGIWRRFERINSDKVIISDYAHTPSAVKGTILAAKEFFPNQRLMVVFQPHHHNRTKKLFNDFINSFDGADIIIVSEIYDVAGREEEQDSDISSQDLVKAIKQKYPAKDIYYAVDLNETTKKVLEFAQPDDVILIMGAGDIYTIVDDLR